MKKGIAILLLSHSVSFAYEVYEPNSGGTFYVKWCDPVKDEISNLQYIQCGDSTDTKLKIEGVCSNLQSDCGQSQPDYPVQTGDKRVTGKIVHSKKKWEYFSLEQAAKVGYPSTYKPASVDEAPKFEQPHKPEKAIKKP